MSGHSARCPAGVLKVSTPLTVEMTVANDVNIGGQPVDSDIIYGMSDGTRIVGFEAPDKGTYVNRAPCYRAEGMFGTTFSSVQYNPFTPKTSDCFYPSQYVFTLKLDEH